MGLHCTWVFFTVQCHVATNFQGSNIILWPITAVKPIESSFQKFHMESSAAEEGSRRLVCLDKIDWFWLVRVPPMRLLLLLIFAISALGARIREPITYPISYQLHSFNDLRQWHQIFQKGGDFLKIDGHYMLPDFCKSQKRVKNFDPRGIAMIFAMNRKIDTNRLSVVESRFAWFASQLFHISR